MRRGADWIFVLNEDTVLAPDCLTRLVEVGQSDPRIGIVGPMVYHHDEPEVIQSAGGRLDHNWRLSTWGKMSQTMGSTTGLTRWTGSPAAPSWCAGK